MQSRLLPPPQHPIWHLPYLTLPYGEDVLPPCAEASSGPNTHPRINRKVTKSPSAVLTWNHPLPREGLLTWTYLLICTLGISKRISARKHISTYILVTMTSKTPNQETRVPSPRTPCILAALFYNPGCLLQAHPVCCQHDFVNAGCLHQAHPVYYQHYFVSQGVFSEHTLYINSTSCPLGKSASKGED